MEGTNDAKENGPPESPLGPILSPPHKDQSPNASPKTQDANTKVESNTWDQTTEDANREVESNTRDQLIDLFKPAPLVNGFDECPNLLTDNPFATSPVASEGTGVEHDFGLPVAVSEAASPTKSEKETQLVSEEEKNSVIESLISSTLEAITVDASPKSSENVVDRSAVGENDEPNGPQVEQLNRPQVVHEAFIEFPKDQETAKPQEEEKSEAKTVVQLSSQDVNINSSLKRSHTIATTTGASVKSDLITKSTASDKLLGNARGQIDTAAPFESVKAAVSKFGGILDWKAHRANTRERRKFIELELEAAKEEIPVYKKQADDAEVAKLQVLKELASTKRLVEELKLNLERAQTEEHQAKQDSELAKLRVEEMEQGIADDASIAARAQLEVARARNAAAASELKTVRDELEQLRRDYALLLTEKDAAVQKAQKATSAAKEVEKAVENLTIELISAKESLESAHATLLEADEHRVGAVIAKVEDTLNWEKELKEAGEELEKLNQRISLAKGLKSKFDSASGSLQHLKAELAAYMESNSNSETVVEANLRDALDEPEMKTHGYFKAAIASARKELESTKLNMEKATTEANCLKVECSSLKSQLEKEQSELSSFHQREGMASITITSLEDELNRINSDIVVAHQKEQEQREKKTELLKKLQDAAQDAERAKSLARMARERFEESQQEAQEAKAGARAMESRLRVTQKEIESAKASEKVALAAINALQASEAAMNNVDSPAGLTISLEEYYELNKQVHEAEELANTRVAAAISEIELAKEAEMRGLSRLQEVDRVIVDRKAALEVATNKAEKANQDKLSVEQELRKLRAENEQKQKVDDSAPGTRSEEENEPQNKSDVHHGRPVPHSSNHETESSREVKVSHKKKKFFPRIFMFFARKKVSSKSK